MAGSRRGAAVVVGLALAGATALVGATPASASSVKPQGKLTCTYSTAIHFSPPLTPGIGTAVPKGTKELITIEPATLGGCSGTVSPGSAPSSGSGVSAVTVKQKPYVFNHHFYAGGCNFISPFGFPKKPQVFNWTAAGETVVPTKAKVFGSALESNGGGDLGYIFKGTASGSFGGPTVIDAFFDAPSTAAVQNCVNDLGGPIASVTVDPTVSSISVG